MSDFLDAFQRRHRETLNQLERREVDAALLDEIRALVEDLRKAGEVIADPAERGQLRALIRFWGGVVYDHTGVYPNAPLLPPDTAQAHPPEERTRRPPPSLAWTLIGGAATVIIAAGLVTIGRMSLSRTRLEETPHPVKPPLVRYAVVGTGLGEDGELETAAETFCLGSPEIVASFALEDMRPGIELDWELHREGEVVSAQAAAPWGQEMKVVTIRIRAAGPDGLEPGQYDLLLYANGQRVGVQSFEVLGTAPRVFNLQVADVPMPSDAASRGKREFEPGVRVIFLSYEHAGLCTGLDLSHTLYREGEPIQETLERWRGAPQGQAEIIFQASDSLPLAQGDYEAAVALARAEQGRVAFAIQEEEVIEEDEEVEEESEAIPPALGEITLALGVHSDGTPLLAAVDNQFEWDTKVVYGIFEYAGMREGMTWTAVWRRSGLEVARQEWFWSEKADETEGTQWAAYYDVYGQTLPGGNYSMTLYMDSAEQRTADFRILYYNR